MKRYEVKIYGVEEKVVEASSPVEAFKKLHPNANILPVKRPSMSHLSIKLIGGQRNSVNFYVIEDNKNSSQSVINELTIVFKGHNYIYFKTTEHTVKGAYKQFQMVCEKNGINMDNMPVIHLTLRNSRSEDIEDWKMEN